MELQKQVINIGAFINRIGFGAHYAIIIIRNAQISIGNYLGPYGMGFGFMA